jgi:nicotinamide riboside transporter PnuC
VGGDGWFGSMVAALEAKKCLNVDSALIIKGNHAFYPIGALRAVIKAHFGTKISGHWVTMTTTIAGIKMTAMAYAWSQKGISYFLSICGSTQVFYVLYRSAFENEFGNVDYKFLPRAQIAHFTFEYLPLIDEHKKQRQAVLGLEWKWLTQC